MDDGEPSRLASVTGHPGAPRLLDAVDRLGVRRTYSGREQNESQDGEAGAERTHDRLTESCAVMA